MARKVKENVDIGAQRRIRNINYRRKREEAIRGKAQKGTHSWDRVDEKENLLSSRSFHVCLKKRERVGDESQSHVTKGTTRRQFAQASFREGKVSLCVRDAKWRNTQQRTVLFLFFLLKLLQHLMVLRKYTCCCYILTHCSRGILMPGKIVISVVFWHTNPSIQPQRCKS